MDVLENDALNKELKEELRMKLAQKNGCQYCKAKGQPTGSLKDEKSSVCIDLQKCLLRWTKFRTILLTYLKTV